MTYTKEESSQLHEQTFAYLELEEKDHVLYITLNRPTKKNALNEVLSRELAYALSYAHHQAQVWVVVLAANGSIFCAGADLKTFMGVQDEDSGSTIPEESNPIILGDLFKSLHKPCIAKVAAPVYAGGFLLLAGCTQVIATTDSNFTLSEVRRGIWPFQVMASLMEIMPKRKVLDWCMTGAVWSAKQAYEAGLVTHLVADAAMLDQEVAQLIQTLQQNSPSAIRLGLQAAQAMESVENSAQHAFLHQCLMDVIQTKDAQEGMMAFRQKRPPQWTGE